MASRPLLKPFSVIENEDMSADITSKVTVISNTSMVSYSIVWSAGSTPIGSIVLEASDDYTENADGSVRNPGTWTALPLSSPTDISGNTGNGIIDITMTAHNALRLRYARTSGSGTLNAIIAGKVA